MDRELDSSELRRRSRSKAIRWMGGLVALLLLIVGLPRLFRPGVERDRIRLATVERGPLEASITASGQVLPAFEKVLSSPTEARVEQILHTAGALIEEGDEILRLDTSASQLALDRLEQQLAEKTNEEEQLQLDLKSDLVELASQIDSARLDLEILQHRANQNRRLFDEGLISESRLQEAEVEAKKSAIDLERLEESQRSARRSTQKKLESIALKTQILRKERDEAKRQLELATIRSDRAGVLTWVVQEEGATVQRGDVLARIADLGTFRVEATTSDLHASRIGPAQTVKVLIDQEELPGKISQVYPTIEEGSVKFVVTLEDDSDSRLINNLRVDVLVVTGSKDDVLRVRRGPFAQGGGSQEVFVVEGDQALRQTVRIGLTGFRYYEIADGLAEGDQIIISDMEEHLHRERLRLK